jgi:hypothetical protein
VDFRETSERLHLANAQEPMSRGEAVLVFDHWIAENAIKSEPPDSTQRIMIEPPRVKLPKAQ